MKQFLFQVGAQAQIKAEFVCGYCLVMNR